MLFKKKINLFYKTENFLKLIKNFLYLFLVLFPQLSNSQDMKWQKLISKNGMEIYLATNLSKWNERKNLLLTFMTSNEKSLGGSSIHSQIILKELDCINYRYAFNLIISKDKPRGEGKTLNIERYPNKWISLGRGDKDFYQEMLFDTCNEDHVKRQLRKLR